jgi:hypothetical protein
MNTAQTLHVLSPHGACPAAGSMMDLGRGFTLSPDAIIGNGVACFGAPGSGKTGILVRLLEQAAPLRIPIIAFDKEGDLTSAVSRFPRGVVGTYTNCPLAHDILAPDGGLQVVYDLTTWPQIEQAGQMIATLVGELLVLTSKLPYHERIPVLVALDEAAYWLPQRRGQYLTPSTFTALHDAFHTLATAGRKRGLSPLLFTQKISEVSKTVLAPGWYIFLRQTVDTDLKRYMEYLLPTGDLTARQIKQRLSTFPTGKGVVKMPDGAQKLVTFHERESVHLSHTPSAQAAWSRYGALPAINPDASFGGYGEGEETVSHDASVKPTKRGRTGRDKPAPTQKTAAERVQAFLSVDPTLRPVDLVELAECDQAVASRARKAYFEAHPEKAAIAAQARRPMGKTERRIRELLAENPDYTASQLRRRTNYSGVHVKQVLARIRSADSEPVERTIC